MSAHALTIVAHPAWLGAHTGHDLSRGIDRTVGARCSLIVHGEPRTLLAADPDDAALNGDWLAAPDRTWLTQTVRAARPIERIALSLGALAAGCQALVAGRPALDPAWSQHLFTLVDAADE